MPLVEDRYVVYERKVVDGQAVHVEVEDALVLTPETLYGTSALMALARCWQGLDAAVAAQLRQTAVDWAPPVVDSQAAHTA